jgi:N-acetylglutamate synthase-like GNAT family acetyltransferase
MPFTIGPAPPDRLPEVIRLLISAKIGAEENLSADFVIEATDGSTLVGCCALDFVKNVTIVHNLAVEKPMRRKGIGRALVEYSVKIAALRHTELMVALTMFWNVNFFRKLGFSTTSRKMLPASLEGRPLIFDPALRRATPMVRKV